MARSVSAFSLTALLASLPPASLAETDLPRFAAQALGRRRRAELPGLRALLGEESLRGYPPSLGPLLLSLVEELIDGELDPAELDVRAVDRMFASERFLARLGAKVEVRRQRLRPGTPLAGGVRTMLESRLSVVPGTGPQLVLILPVDLAQVPDARFSVPLGPVVARAAEADEADYLRETWARIEEVVGLGGPEANRWEARYFAIARRGNDDAEAARSGLAGLAAEARLRLWDALVAHLRDQELPEQHRPGRRGLERRLARLGLELEVPWVRATHALAEGAYRAAAADPDVERGWCPCDAEDLALWTQWVDVPASGRDRLAVLEPAEVERLLVNLAEEEAGHIEARLDEGLRRPLQSLRDGVLAPRWRRSRHALRAVDPLVLAETALRTGNDVGQLRAALEALASEVARRGPVVSAPGTGLSQVEVASGPSATVPPPDEATQLSVKAIHIPDVAAASVAPEAVRERPLTPGPTPAALQAISASDLPPLAPLPAPLSSPAAAGAPKPTAASAAPSRFVLPPMPEPPPPRPRPRTRPRTDTSLPPLPIAPPFVPPAAPSATTARAASLTAAASASVSTGRVADLPMAPIHLGPPTPSSMTVPNLPRPPRPATRPAIAQPVTSAGIPPRSPLDRGGSRARLPTAPHLVTPRQGNEFYDASFRELELIERDLLHRGPFPAAEERISAISHEALELQAALGPAARSGDRDFGAALQRIEKVQAYLERIRPLLVGSHPRSVPPSDPGAPGARPGLLKRLFNRGARD